MGLKEDPVAGTCEHGKVKFQVQSEVANIFTDWLNSR
jgi:hypothetical protein